jgi:hypothetical protein
MSNIDSDAMLRRLQIAQESGSDYVDLAQMFEAATTFDIEKLQKFKNHSIPAVKFASYCNQGFHTSLTDLEHYPLSKFAAVFNPSTSQAILDEIGLNQTTLNPVIPEKIHSHKNVSKEFQAFKAITDLGINEELYEDESEKYFYEAIFSDGEVRKVIDLESLEALFYLHMLGFISAPRPSREFWEYFLDAEPVNWSKNVDLFGSLPAIPDNLYEECEAIIGARCLAGAWTKNQELMRTLAWDRQLLNTGVGGFYWQDSRSPRSGVASNEGAPAELLRAIFEEDSKDSAKLNDFPHPIFWRLSCNPAAPGDVLAGIISLIESESISDEYVQSELLVGEPEDFPYGLITNPAVKGELRARVEKLMRDRDLDPDDFEILN